MGTAKRKRRPATIAKPPAIVPIDATLLDVVRARYPVARDWTDAELAAGCLAMAIKQPPRIGLVHTD